MTASHVPFFATTEGRGIGTSFAINTMIRALTGKRPMVLGKPSREGFYAALAGMGLPRSAAAEVVVVGDDPGLETRMANDVGAVSVGVATGLYDLAAFRAAPARGRPLLALPGVDALLDLVG